MEFHRDARNALIDCQQLKGQFNFSLWKMDESLKSHKNPHRTGFKEKGRTNIRVIHKHPLPQPMVKNKETNFN